MSWVSLTTSSLATVLSSTELTQFTTVNTGSLNQNTIIQNTINDVVALVRGKVASNPQNSLDVDTTTIPDSLVTFAEDILAVKLMKRLGGITVDIDAIRKEDYKRAFEELDKVANGETAIEEPTTATDTIFAKKNPIYIGMEDELTYG